MTVGRHSIQKIISSQDYINAVDVIRDALRLDIEYDVYDVSLDLDVKSLQAADLSVDEIISVLAVDANNIVRFSVLKFRGLAGDNNDGEFPSDELQAADEVSEVVETHPMQIDFLIAYIVEYILVSAYPEKLLAYLKELRIPYAKKYAAQLHRWADGKL